MHRCCALSLQSLYPFADISSPAAPLTYDIMTLYCNLVNCEPSWLSLVLLFQQLGCGVHPPCCWGNAWQPKRRSILLYHPSFLSEVENTKDNDMTQWLNNSGYWEERKMCSWPNYRDAQPGQLVLFLSAGSLIDAALCQDWRDTNYTPNRCCYLDAIHFIFQYFNIWLRLC